MAEVAAGASDLTRAADAAVVAERVQELSEMVEGPGIVDVAEGVGAVDERRRRARYGHDGGRGRQGRVGARPAARAVGRADCGRSAMLFEMLDHASSGRFLDERGMRLQDIAVDQAAGVSGTARWPGQFKKPAERLKPWASKK